MSLNIVNSFRLTPPPPLAIGGWVELGRTTLVSVSDTVTVSGLANKRYLMVLTHVIKSGNAIIQNRLNSDSGTNYANRRNTNGAGEATNVNGNIIEQAIANGGEEWQVQYISNLASRDKLLIQWLNSSVASGAAQEPSRQEQVAKWANTVDAVNTFNLLNGSSGDFASGTEVVVLGWDPGDTHTDNFWEELFSGTGTSLDTGVAGITAKKYLWIQTYLDLQGGAGNASFTYNGDVSGTYGVRFNLNGGSDGSDVNRVDALIPFQGQPSAQRAFCNTFMLNNLANEKLAINHVVWTNALGSATAPNIQEHVAKWANTSAQITDVAIGGTYGATSKMKIWGSN